MLLDLQRVKIKRVEDNPLLGPLPAPAYAREGDAGFDLRSRSYLTIWPGAVEKVPTGFCYEIPAGYELQVRPRSGMAFKRRLVPINAPGTIDSGYRGEVCVLLENRSDRIQHIDRGERIAQGVLAEHAVAEFELVEELGDSERGEDGFGSTGST